MLNMFQETLSVQIMSMMSVLIGVEQMLLEQMMLGQMLSLLLLSIVR